MERETMFVVDLRSGQTVKIWADKFVAGQHILPDQYVKEESTPEIDLDAKPVVIPVEEPEVSSEEVVEESVEDPVEEVEEGQDDDGVVEGYYSEVTGKIYKTEAAKKAAETRAANKDD